MKNKHFYLITLLFITLSINNILSQDIIDPPKLQNSLLNLNSNFIKRDFNKFMISWNLTSPNRTMDSLLHINYALTVASSMPDWQILPSTNPDSNWYYFGRPVSQHGPDYLSKQYRLVCTPDYNDNVPQLGGYAMRYNPDIIIDSSDIFTPSDHNAKGTIFGWNYQNAFSYLFASSN